MRNPNRIYVFGGTVAILATAGLVTTAFAQPGREGVMTQILTDGEAPVAAFVTEAQARATALDTDGDGVVTRAELEANRDARRAEHERRRFPDANEDGVVSTAEFLAAAEQRFARLDANGDGVLSPDELKDDRPGRRRGGYDGQGKRGAPQR